VRRGEEADLIFASDLLCLYDSGTEDEKAQQGNQQPMLVTQQSHTS
jgi:hypothetical protein